MLSYAPGKRSRIAKWAAASSVALALAACGGGGGGGFVSSTPTPPPVAPPPPPPQFAISAPAKATTGPGIAPVVADVSGPNFTTGAAEGTTFPLLHTSLAIDAARIGPETAVNAAGGTATVVGGKLLIDIGAFEGEPAYSGYLDWTRAGYWSVNIPEGTWDYGGDTAQHGVFVVGYETPSGAMPTTGSATYTGFAFGRMYVPSSTTDALPCMCQEVPVQGDAFLTANFGARTVTGELTNMYRVWWDESRWNDVTFTSVIAGNGFSGTTSVTGAVDLGMRANATGTLEGRFFGPSAEEVGAVWTLFDGTNAAIGTLGGRRGP